MSLPRSKSCLLRIFAALNLPNWNYWLWCLQLWKCCRKIY